MLHHTSALLSTISSRYCRCRQLRVVDSGGYGAIKLMVVAAEACRRHPGRRDRLLPDVYMPCRTTVAGDIKVQFWMDRAVVSAL
jgi:hypothetical protein